MKDSERDFVRIKHIEQSVLLIEQFTTDTNAQLFSKDLLKQSAVIRQFEIIGEAATAISEKTKNQFPQIEWQKIKRFRNLLVHEYFRVDAGQVWTTIENDLPILKQQLSEILKSFKK